jgi:4-amino-4-deoxy-L-arabinose transferase-like glycosyltransferase
MSGRRGSMNVVVRVTFLALLGLLTLALGLLLLIFFVPIVGWYVWTLSDRNRELEARIAVLEGTRKPKSDQS